MDMPDEKLRLVQLKAVEKRLAEPPTVKRNSQQGLISHRDRHCEAKPRRVCSRIRTDVIHLAAQGVQKTTNELFLSLTYHHPHSAVALSTTEHAFGGGGKYW